MPRLSILVAFTGLLIALATAKAIPTVPDLVATKTTACKAYKTYNARFDALAVGSTPTAGYMSVSWDGWTVENATGYGINAESNSYVAQSSSAESSTITIDSDEIVMELRSFYFACISLFPDSTDNYYIPSGCSLMVTGIPYTHLLNIASAGPYSFNANYTALQDGIALNMTKVDLDLGSSQYYFQVVGGAPSTLVLIDNVIMVQQNYCPD